MTKLIVANWKANKNITEAQQWVKKWRQQDIRPEYEHVLCPPYPLLPFLLDAVTANLKIGVQDISAYPPGAYTGEVNGYNLQQMAISYALVGHSERRRYIGETSQLIAKKVAQALDFNITPIVCLDKEQVIEQAELIPANQRQQLIVAYEPVHAISTFGGQEDPLPTTLAEVAKIKEHFGESVPVLYGGSVNPDNSLVYLQQESIAGILVGSASLEPSTFAAL